MTTPGSRNSARDNPNVWLRVLDTPKSGTQYALPWTTFPDAQSISAKPVAQPACQGDRGRPQISLLVAARQRSAAARMLSCTRISRASCTRISRACCPVIRGPRAQRQTTLIIGHHRALDPLVMRRSGVRSPRAALKDKQSASRSAIVVSGTQMFRQLRGRWRIDQCDLPRRACAQRVVLGHWRAEIRRGRTHGGDVPSSAQDVDIHVLAIPQQEIRQWRVHAADLAFTNGDADQCRRCSW